MAPQAAAGSMTAKIHAWKHCRYLHFIGINKDASFWKQTSAEADNYLCRMFDN